MLGQASKNIEIRAYYFHNADPETHAVTRLTITFLYQITITYSKYQVSG